MKSTLLTTFRRASHNVFHNMTVSRTRRHVIEKFTKRVSLIYFGAVNQHHDEHRIIRGFTVSSTHLDNHYSIGTVDGIDVSLVDRSDAISKPDGSMTFYNWMVMTFDLKTKQDVPHIFINANNHDNTSYNSLFTTYPMLVKVDMGTFESYDPEFTSRFTVYAALTDAVETERLFPSETARAMGVHFWPYSIEVHEGILYIYSNDKKITSSTLNTMLENGLWLARYIDSQIEQI